MCATVVDRLFKEFDEMLLILKERQEISLQSAADDSFRKSLLLSAASYFERTVTESVTQYFSEAVNNNSIALSFVKNKAINRQYHTWFDWKSNNANVFFALFGEEFLSFMKQSCRDSPELASAIKAFIEIGSERNRLVHQDYGSFPLEKTSSEIFGLYQRALRFVESLPGFFKAFSESKAVGLG